MGQNLLFNILTFDWPKGSMKFNFHSQEQKKLPRIYKTLFPSAIASIFPKIPATQKFIATTFTGEAEGFTPLTIDFKTENPDLIKRYYNKQINYYFRKVAPQVIKQTFIKENQIWILLNKQSTNKYWLYDKFTLGVQLAEVSNYPELLLSYDGRSKVLKRNVTDLIQYVEPGQFNWVLYDNQISKYEKMADWEDVDYNKVYPQLNKNLRASLAFPIEVKPRDNRYKGYLSKITQFYVDHLDNEEFRKLIPLHKNGFLPVAPTRVNATDKDCNKLSFGKKTGVDGFDIAPNNGMKLHGPFKRSPYNNIHVFYILHKDNVATAKTINGYLQGGLGFFKGIYSYAEVLLHTEDKFSIGFNDKENPIAEIEEKLKTRTFNPDSKYIAIYITPFSKYEEDLSKREIYYRIKELLLKRGITSQVVDPTKINPDDPKKTYAFSLTNISVAILAKLGGTPWRLNTPVKNELIVGVGAFKHTAIDVQYIGSAFSFNNTGGFNRFEYFMKHEIDVLAGSISRAIREYATVNNPPERLIIHFYKTMSDKELAPIQAALEEIDLNIPVFIVSINKTESEDIVVFDKGWTELMPLSGTYINIGKNRYLLCNNTRYSGTIHSSADGYPFPIKLKIDCNDKTQLQETRVTKELIEQVYQFSRMYWKSVRQQNLPVTIKYPEMVAEMAPHFEEGIPAYGKDNLWFL